MIVAFDDLILIFLKVDLCLLSKFSIDKIKNVSVPR